MKQTQHFSHGGIGSFKSFLRFFFPSHYAYKRPDRPKRLSKQLIDCAKSKRECKNAHRKYDGACGGWRVW